MNLQTDQGSHEEFIFVFESIINHTRKFLRRFFVDYSVGFDFQTT